MNVLICIDDTDDVTKETSTGKIAGIISRRLKKLGGTSADGISRHQLILDDQVKYTSHNSSMCLDMVLPGDVEKDLVAEICRSSIRDNMSQISDPGLAVCFVDEVDDPQELIRFGFEAKRRVLTRESAFALADRTDWILLEELGGDGSGVIGALAGIGLRLSRSDGAIRGRLGEDLDGAVMSAKEFCARYGADFVVDMEGRVLAERAQVRINEWTRLMFYDGHKVCLGVCGEDGVYTLVSQHEERERLGRSMGGPVCMQYVQDNDEEECVHLGSQSCFNCLFRRWTGGGFLCMKTAG